MGIRLTGRGTTQGPSDRLETLAHYRTKSSTGPKGKVYAIARLTSLSKDPNFVVGYSKTVQEVYIDLPRYVITTSRGLPSITVGNVEIHPSWIISWAPNWSKCPTIAGGGPQNESFNASLGSHADVVFDPLGRILWVKGICARVVECIAKLLRSHGDQHLYDDENLRRVLSTIYNWNELAGRTTGDEASQEEASHKGICRSPYAHNGGLLHKASKWELMF